MSIIQSTDDGKTWKQRTLEADGELSYPSIIQTDDGMIDVSYTYRRYTIKHVAFDEGWLVHERIETDCVQPRSHKEIHHANPLRPACARCAAGYLANL